MVELDTEDRAYARGVEAGKLDVRVRGLEDNQRATSAVLSGLTDLVNSLVTTVKLLASESASRAESDRKMWDQRDKAAADTAKAIKEEKDSAAEVLKNVREATATALLKESTETNSKWAPRMGWLTFALVLSGVIGAFVTFYATFHR